MRLTQARDPRENPAMRGVFKAAAVHIVLAAMVLRALLPAGWMPSPLHTGSPLMICDGTMPMHDMLGMPGMDHDAMASMPGMHHDMPAHPQSHDHGTPCVFAAAAPLAPPALDVAAPVAAPAAHDIDFAAHRDAIAASRAYRPNAARGPPLST